MSLDSQGQASVHLDIDLLDPSGQPAHSHAEGDISDSVGKSGAFRANFFMDVEPYFPAGTYTVVIKATDQIGKSSATLKQQLVVARERPAEPFDRLAIRDFTYSVVEHGAAVKPPVFEPGQDVFREFHAGGLKFRSDFVDLQLGVKVTAPDGSTVLNEPNAFHLADKAPYHPPAYFVNLHYHFPLPPNAPAGTYTEEVTVTDRNANQKVSYATKFVLKGEGGAATPAPSASAPPAPTGETNCAAAQKRIDQLSDQQRPHRIAVRDSEEKHGINQIKRELGVEKARVTEPLVKKLTAVAESGDQAAYLAAAKAMQEKAKEVDAKYKPRLDAAQKAADEADKADREIIAKLDEELKIAYKQRPSGCSSGGA